MRVNNSGIFVVLVGLAVLGAVLSGAWFLLSDDGPDDSKLVTAVSTKKRENTRPSQRIRSKINQPDQDAANKASLDAAKATALDPSASKGTSKALATSGVREAAKAEDGKSAKPRARMDGDTGLIVAAADASKDGEKKAGEVGVAEEVPPAPVGSLIVTVVNADTLAPVNAAEVYAPLPVSRIAVDGSSLKVPTEFNQFRKLANAKGEATFNGKDLDKANGADGKPASNSVQVLATFINMVPSVATFDLAHIKKSGGRVTVKLAPSILITGLVADPKGVRIGGATIELRQGEPLQSDANGSLRFDARKAGSFETTANPQGEFRIAVAKNFAYQAVVTADGFAPYTSKVFDFRRDEQKLTFTLRHGRSIEGYVMLDGVGVAGADVSCLTDGSKVRTANDGKFYITAIQDRVWSNRVTLRVTKAGLSPLVTEQLVNTEDLRIEMTVAATISGVVMLDGVPAVGAVIESSFRQGDRDWAVPNVRSGKEGVFKIPGLGEGTVKLRATSTNDKVSRYEYVNLKAGLAYEGVILNLQSAAVVNGRVVTKGPSGQEVGVAGALIRRDGRNAATSDGVGNFKIGGLGDDSSELTIFNRGKLPEHLEGLPLFTIDGVKFYTIPAPIRVNTNPGKEYPIVFEVVPFYDEVVRSVTLAFVLNSGTNVEGVRMALTPAIAVAPNGVKVPEVVETFDIIRGEAQIKLLLVEGVDYTARITHSRINAKTVTAAQLKGIVDLGSLNVPLVSAMALTGYVRDSAGNAIPDADCTVLEAGKAVSSGKTDQHGFFDLGGLKAKEYTLNVFRHSYYLSSQKIKATTFNPTPTEVVLLAANEIRLLVTNANGVPMPGVNVRISRPSGTSNSAPIEYFNLGETDGQGRKITNFHWIRNYQVIAHRGNAEIGFVNFDNLKAQNTREFTLKLEPAALIAGRVTSSTSGQRVSDVDVYARLDGAAAPRAGNSFWARANANGEFTVLLPANGQYTMCVRESRAYAGSSNTSATPGESAVNVTVPPKDNVQGNWAEVLSVSVPGGIRAGQQFEAQIFVRNRGTTTWTDSEGYRLGSQAPQDNSRWGMGRISLGTGVSVPPGGTAVFTAMLTAPGAGTHAMQWRMVQERREWFGEYSAGLSVVVQPAGQ